jgi:hypothetical protein
MITQGKISLEISFYFARPSSSLSPFYLFPRCSSHISLSPSLEQCHPSLSLSPRLPSISHLSISLSLTKISHLTRKYLSLWLLFLILGFIASWSELFMVVSVIVGGGWANTLLRQILQVNPLSQCFLFSLFFFLK